MKTALFDYHLPASAIAQFPLRPAEQAKLLHFRPQKNASCILTDRLINDLPDMFKAGDALIVNNTKVLPASFQGFRKYRLMDDDAGSKEGAKNVAIHFNLIEPLDDRVDDNQNHQWRIMAYPGKRLRVGDKVEIADDFYFTLEAKEAGGMMRIAFNCRGDALTAAFHQYGKMPIPPYLGRDAQESDKQDYQTCFASKIGAAAAPTAGLHFTEKLRHRLEAKEVKIIEVTLHVGAGTFLPVKTDEIEDHPIHYESGELSNEAAAAINACHASGGRIIAVGTTALRLVEWACLKAQSERLSAQKGKVDLFIRPGFKFNVCDMLLTNFHQPRSTLLALVGAFSGLDNIMTGYQYALANHYRFLSYGDACLLEPAL